MGTSLTPLGALANIALPALSGLSGGLGSGQLSQTAQTEQYNLNKRNVADAEAELADQLSRQTQTNPLRDQTIANLANLLGASPAAFNPTNFAAPTNTGQQGVGGTNLNAVAAANAAYTPGAGGVTSNVQQMILNRLGYGNVGTGTLYDNGTTPPDVLTSSPAAASTGGSPYYGGQGATGATAGNATPTALTPSRYAPGFTPGGTVGAAPNPTPAPSGASSWTPGSGGNLSALTKIMQPATSWSPSSGGNLSALANIMQPSSPVPSPATSGTPSATPGLSPTAQQQKLLAQQMGLMGSLGAY